jgi:poly-gamma-glutamate capsule biosynthesis protein CapA/YwtB (metallophosphatase superfamily)
VRGEAFVSQQDILILAKEGDAKAIAFLITQALQSFGVTAKASRENDGLHLLLEGEQLPAEEACIRVAVKGLQRLQPKNVYSLTIYGRQHGQQLPAWTQKIELKQALTAKPASTPAAKISDTLQKVENQQKVKSSIELISSTMLQNGQDARSTTQKVAGGTVILPVAESATTQKVADVNNGQDACSTTQKVAGGTVILPVTEVAPPPQVASGTVILPMTEVTQKVSGFQNRQDMRSTTEQVAGGTGFFPIPQTEKSPPKPAEIPTAKPTNQPQKPQRKLARSKTKKPRISIGVLSLILVPISGLVLGSQFYKPSTTAASNSQNSKPGLEKGRSTPSPAPATQPLPTSKSPSQAAQIPVNLPATVSIKAVGDIIPGTNFPYNKLPENKNLLFKSVKPYLQGADILFGNFESTMTDYPYSSKGNGGGMLFAFRTPPSYAKLLKDAGFDILSVANNHSYDFHEQGFKDTIKNIDSNGMKAVGKRDQIVYKNVKGVNFAFIGFSNYGEVHNSLLELKAGAAVVKKAKEKADIVVISVHAGAEGSGAINVRNKTEFFYGENRGNMVLFSRTMIDAGADLILGHGPHVMRALELYKGKLIAYSLGNFMGYRTLSTAGTLGQSLILDVKMNPQGDFVSGKIIPVELNSRGIPFIDDDFRSVGLMRSLTKSDFPNTGLKIDDKGQILKK